MKKIVDFLAVILRPDCWIRVGTYNAAWDAELSWLLDNGYRFERLRECKARIAEYEVWIENHPYASFSVDGDLLPRRATALRAMRVFRQDYKRVKSEDTFKSDMKLRSGSMCGQQAVK